MAEPPDPVKSNVETAMIDVADTSLDDLDELGSSSLAHALWRVLASEEDPSDPVVGFQSSI